MHIDTYWISEDVDISACVIIPFCFGIGYHIGIFVEITLQYLIGGCLLKPTRPNKCRLQIWITKVRNRYRNWRKAQMIHHKLLPFLHIIYIEINPPPQYATGETPNKSDEKCTDIGLGGGKRYQKPRMGILDFWTDINKPKNLVSVETGMQI